MEGNKYDKEEDSKVEIMAEVSKEQLRDELKTNSDDNTNNERNSVKINLLSERNNYKFPIVLINDYFQSSTESDDKGTSRNFERVTIKPSKNNKLIVVSNNFFQKFQIKEKKVLDYEEDLALYFTGSKLFPNSDCISSSFFGFEYQVPLHLKKRTNNLYLGNLVPLPPAKKPSSPKKKKKEKNKKDKKRSSRSRSGSREKGGSKSRESSSPSKSSSQTNDDNGINVLNVKGCEYVLYINGDEKKEAIVNQSNKRTIKQCLLEFLCCEAMQGLKIPTRLACGVTMDKEKLNGTIMYFSKSYLHFGNFLTTTRKCNTSESQKEQLEHIKNLIDSSTELFTQYEPVYKNIDSTFVKDPTNKYLLFFRNVVENTAKLIGKYQAIGFVHGNISSENLSICGIGNGYDMFTFIDEYDINFKSNLVDKVGLYSLKNQKQSCRQECETIGQSIMALFTESTTSNGGEIENKIVDIDNEKHFLTTPLEELVEHILINSFDKVYDETYWNEMRKKAGIPSNKGEVDIILLQELLNLMDESKVDYHNVWLALEKFDIPIQWPFEWDQARDVTKKEDAEKLEELSEEQDKIFEEVLADIMKQVATLTEKKAMLRRLLYTDTTMDKFVNLSTSNPENLFVNHTSNNDLNYHMGLRLEISKLNAIDPDVYYREMRQKWMAWLRKYLQRLENEIDYDALFEKPPPEPEEPEEVKPETPSKKSKKKKKGDKKEKKDKKKKKKKLKKKKWGKKTPYKLSTKMHKPLAKKRLEYLKNRNPKLILRRYIAKEAIDDVIEKNDYSKLRALALALKNPYDETLYEKCLKDVNEKKLVYDDLRARRLGGRVLAEHLSTRHASGNRGGKKGDDNDGALFFPYVEEEKLYLRQMHIGFKLINTTKKVTYPYILEKPPPWARGVYDYVKI